jgi:hypothetical protein
MSAFSILDIIITKIKVLFYKIVDKLALAGILVFSNISLFTIF